MWIEDPCSHSDHVAHEDNSYIATWNERERYEKNGKFAMNAQGRMDTLLGVFSHHLQENQVLLHSLHTFLNKPTSAFQERLSSESCSSHPEIRKAAEGLALPAGTSCGVMSNEDTSAWEGLWTTPSLFFAANSGAEE